MADSAYWIARYDDEYGQESHNGDESSLRISVVFLIDQRIFSSSSSVDFCCSSVCNAIGTPVMNGHMREYATVGLVLSIICFFLGLWILIPFA